MLASVESLLVDLYGPLAKTDDCVSHDANVDPLPSDAIETGPVNGRTKSNAVNIVSSSHRAALPQAPLDSSDVHSFGAIEQTPARASDPANNTSLNQTSSSSSSEDWIINKSSFDMSHVDSSLVDDDFLSTSHDNKEAPERRVAAADLSSVTPKTDGSISAESWSAGQALMDPVGGGLLEPVKLHVLSERPQQQQQQEVGEEEVVERCRGSSPLSKKPSNIIVARMPKLTAFELIGSRAVSQPASARALFERDSRASILLEDPGASLQDVTTAVKERWESLGEEDRKK